MGQKALPEAREALRGPLKYSGVVGMASRRSRKPSKRSG